MADRDEFDRLGELLADAVHAARSWPHRSRAHGAIADQATVQAIARTIAVVYAGRNERLTSTSVQAAAFDEFQQAPPEPSTTSARWAWRQDRRAGVARRLRALIGETS